MFWLFGQEACEILFPWPGIESAPSALESEILTTEPPPGKALHYLLMWISPPILLFYMGGKGIIFFFISLVRFIQKSLYFLSYH